VDIQIGGRAEALDERDRAGVGSGNLREHKTSEFLLPASHASKRSSAACRALRRQLVLSLPTVVFA